MIAILYDGYGYSFTKTAKLTYQGLSKLGYKSVLLSNFRTTLGYLYASKSIFIWDTVLFSKSRVMVNALVHQGKTILWADSPGTVSMLDPNSFGDVCLITCHPYWYREYMKAGIPVYGWVPRPIDYDTATKVASEDRATLCKDLWAKYGRYLFTIGSDLVVGNSNPPRKGFDAYDQMCSEIKKKHNVNCLFSGYYPVKNAVTISGTGGLSEYELLRLMRCSEAFVWATRSEGFGMPPVEAMSVGSIVVSSNAPINDLIIGIKFDYVEEKDAYSPRAQMYFKIFDYKIVDLVDSVDYALSMSEDEKEELRIKVSKAREVFREDYVAYALSQV